MSTVQFINNLSSSAPPPSHNHDHGSGGHTHDHGDHGHTHEHLDNPGESLSHSQQSLRFANFEVIQESMLNAKCQIYIQETSKNADLLSVSEGERHLPTPSTSV